MSAFFPAPTPAPAPPTKRRASTRPAAVATAPAAAPARKKRRRWRHDFPRLHPHVLPDCTPVFRFIKAHALAHLTPDNPRLALVISTSPQLRGRSPSLSRPFLSSLFLSLSLSASLCLPACLSVSVSACLFCVCACARPPCVRLIFDI